MGLEFIAGALDGDREQSYSSTSFFVLCACAMNVAGMHLHYHHVHGPTILINPECSELVAVHI